MKLAISPWERVFEINHFNIVHFLTSFVFIYISLGREGEALDSQVKRTSRTSFVAIDSVREVIKSQP